MLDNSQNNDKKRILIVEDEEDLNKFYQNILGKAGYAVDFAYNGQEALIKIKNNSFDLLMLDILLPKLNGIDLLNKMKALNLFKQVKHIILWTNLSALEIEQPLDAFPIEKHLEKSNYSPEEIIQEINQLLND